LKATKLKTKAVQLRQMNWKKGSEYDVTTFRFYQILSRKSGLSGRGILFRYVKTTKKEMDKTKEKSNQLSVPKPI
jgi:hypothetical protein